MAENALSPFVPSIHSCFHRYQPDKREFWSNPVTLMPPLELRHTPPTSVAEKQTTTTPYPPSLPATLKLVALDQPRHCLNELPSYVREHASSVTFPEKVRF
jgi:hypothetical protein